MREYIRSDATDMAWMPSGIITARAVPTRRPAPRTVISFNLSWKKLIKLQPFIYISFAIISIYFMTLKKNNIKADFMATHLILVTLFCDLVLSDSASA